MYKKQWGRYIKIVGKVPPTSSSLLSSEILPGFRVGVLLGEHRDWILWMASLCEKDRWSYQHASLRSNIEKSTFPHQPKAGGSPFLSRTGNVLHAFHLTAFACFPFYKRTFQYLTISLWHMFVYKGRQKHVSFCHKSKQFRFLAKEILALRFPSLEREGPSKMVESRILFVSL